MRGWCSPERVRVRMPGSSVPAGPQQQQQQQQCLFIQRTNGTEAAGELV
jgi:hypothetical protein